LKQFCRSAAKAHRQDPKPGGAAAAECFRRAELELREPAMSEQQGQDVKLPDPVELSKSMTDIAERSQKLVSDWLERQSSGGGGGHGLDPLNIGGAFLEMTARMMTDPARLVQAQMSLWHDYMKLWQSATQRMIGAETEPVVQPDKADRRFVDPAWDENQIFDFIKQSYLLSARWMQSTVQEVEGLDDKTAKKVDFYTRQFVDAMAPSNFVMTNPHVLRTTLESGGEPGQGPAEPARGPGARQGPAEHQDDRPGALRGRPQHRGHPGEGGLSERPDAAGPVRADHREGP
jgi:hypothetical protein